MQVGVFRIDDRLIHGQVVTAWIAHADANTIVVADDKAAGDEFQRTLLQMATPNTVELKVLTVEEAKALITDDSVPGRALLLVRGPQQALELVRAGVKDHTINVGNMNMKKGKTKILGNFWVFPEDVDTFKEIYAEGVSAEVRAVPNEHSQDVMDLLKKNGLA